jgi:hypothetical protein
MRHRLLATAALVGFAVAGTAHAATSPLEVTIGGSVDFIAGTSHQSRSSGVTNPTSGDFESLYELSFGVTGKSASGVEYGGNLAVDNYPTLMGGFEGMGSSFAIAEADIFMSGAFGKIILGDFRGVTDIAVTTPVVGEGQVLGRYTDFLDSTAFAKGFVTGIDGDDSSTNVSYFTPTVGNETHEVQVGISYVPDFGGYGSDVKRVQTGAYKNMIKGVVAYTGNFKAVTAGLSGDIINSVTSNESTRRDFTAFGIGAQAAIQKFTLGVNYRNLGHFNMTEGQNKEQQLFGAGATYEFDKVGVGISYLGGEGYSTDLTVQGSAPNAYIKSFNTYGVGGVYTWAPGLTTNADAVLFGQKDEAGVRNDGYVLLVSQKLTF